MADPSQDGAKKVRSGGPSELAKAEERTALWLLIPTFVIILIIAFYPLGQVFVESFRQREFASGNPGTWVGFQNYQQLLAVTMRQLPVELGDDGQPVVEDGEVQYESWVRVLPREPNRYRAVWEFGLFGNRYVVGAITPEFIRAVWDTIVFSVVAVFFETVLGMIIALALTAKFFGRGAMRAAMLVPWAVITAVSARIWEWMLQPTRAGLFNTVGSALGLNDGRTNFFGEAALQLPSMIVMDVWKTTPFMALLLLAGLSTIPKELYEAARVDGANPFRQFFSITLPLLVPTLAVALIFRTLDSLRVFDIFQVVLGRSRYSMASYAQDMLISVRDVGMSSAASVVIFILIFAFAITYIRILGVETE